MRYLKFGFPTAADRAANQAVMRDVFRAHPWLLPVTVAAGAFPAAVAAHGFWQTQRLKQQLRIEREKTQQLQLQADQPRRHAPGARGVRHHG
ncbi:hypothetical protein [Levilactobacillus spicheri]|uniref:hypothetical protein n=1 Tax=Levilactobacillus spicheri TaxID=216463 RepID=UPI00069A0767|nr:hypothetical protein [Levilactobacillus spicheri]